MFTHPFSIPDPDDLKTKDLMEYRKLATKKLVAATLETHAALKVIEETEKLIAWRCLFNKKIKEGDEVTVQFDDGEEQCLYEGCEWSEYSFRTQIKLRHRNKNKKWSANPVFYGLDYLKLLKKISPAASPR